MRLAHLLACWLVALSANAAEGDQACLGCHGQPGLTKSFGADTVSLQVDGAAFGKSVHAPLGCAACHSAVDLKKHPGGSKDYPNARAYGLAAIDASCKNCHQPIHDAWLGSPHGKTRERESGLKGPLCSDCHRPHEVARASVGTKLKETCLTCHAGAPEAHEKWLPNTRRHMEVIACAACHAPAAKRKVDLRFYDATGRNEVVGAHGELQPGRPVDEKALWSLMQGESGRVRLVGRVEVTSADQAHAMAERGQALKDCTTCHRKGAEAFQTVTVSVVGPDGKRERFEARKEVLNAATSVDSVRGFYAVGGTRMELLDWLLLAALAGGISAPLGHFVMRRLSRRKRGNA